MSTMHSEQAAVRMHRTIAAPPGRVYRAWLDPELLRRWLAPGSFIVTRAEVEERVGGRVRIWQEHPDGGTGGFESEIVELVPDARIVFNWGWVGPDRADGPVYDSRLTVTFEPADGGGTELTLVHERLGELFAALPLVADKFEAGWLDVLGKLDSALAAAS